MKVKLKNEELLKVGYRLPARLKQAIENKALAERRSTNDQVIVLLEQSLERTERNHRSQGGEPEVLLGGKQ